MLSVQACIYLGTAYESFGDVSQYLWSILYMYSDVTKYALQKHGIIATSWEYDEITPCTYPGNPLKYYLIQFRAKFKLWRDL